MKNGEVARVLIFKHSHGISLEGIGRLLPRALRRWRAEDQVTFLRYHARAGQRCGMHYVFSDPLTPHKNTVLQIKLALHGITEITKRGILHGDVSVQDMLITPDTDNTTYVVFIDFARCNIDLTEHKLNELGHAEPKDVMTFLTLCCMDHYEDLV